MVERLFFDEDFIFYDIGDFFSNVKNGSLEVDCWPCDERTVEIGDNAYFFAQSEKNTDLILGVFARGKIVASDKRFQVKENYEGFDDLSEAYCINPYNDEADPLFVTFQLDSIVAYDKPLELSWLRQQPEFLNTELKLQFSGQQLPQSLSNAIDKYWEKHLFKLSKKGNSLVLNKPLPSVFAAEK